MVAPILFTLGLIFIIVILIYKYLTWHFNVWKELGLPGPKPQLLLGNFPSAITGKQHLVYDFDEVYSQYKKSHAAIGVFMTRNPEIMLLEPKLGHELLVTNFRKYRDNLSSKWVVDKKSDKIAARNPFFVTGDEWKTTRSDNLAGITLNKLNLAYPIWKESAQKLGRYLQEEIRGGSAVLDTKDLAQRFTVNVMGDFLWGIDAATFTHSSEPNIITKMSIDMLLQSFHAVGLYYLLNAVPFVKRFCNNRFFPEKTDRFFSRLTKDAMAMRLMDGNTSRADYLNYLMQLQEKKNISHDDVMGHIMTTFLDGYETSSTVIFHTLFYLAKYARVQDKLRTEIVENLEDDGWIPFENLNALPYMDQCVNETLRMITPIPILSRICTEPTELEVDSNTRIPIKLGDIVTVPVFSYHHDPDYFPKPYEYNPDRFDNGVHLEMTRQGIFMPFGDGPRICVGMRMALFEIKTALVEILKEYRVKSCSQTMAEKRPDSQAFILGLEGEFWLEYEKI